MLAVPFVHQQNPRRLAQPFSPSAGAEQRETTAARQDRKGACPPKSRKPVGSVAMVKPNGRRPVLDAVHYTNRTTLPQTGCSRSTPVGPGKSTEDHSERIRR